MKHNRCNDPTLNYILIALICSGGFAPFSLGASLFIGVVVIAILLLASNEQKNRKKEQLVRFSKGDWLFSEREAYIAFKGKETFEREQRIEKALMELDLSSQTSKAALEEKVRTPAIENHSHYGGEPHNIFLDDRPRTPSDAGTYFMIVGAALIIFGITVFLASMP